MKDDLKISIIVTVYNAEDTIRNTIESILKSCENERSELVIVNDGSTDRTKDILDGYGKLDNVIVIHQENKGVSVARNKGLDSIDKDTDLITFIDDSDLISENFVKVAKHFFSEHRDIKVAITPIKVMRNEQTYDHVLNYRFQRSQNFIDIMRDYKCIHFHIGGIVFSSELYESGELKFNESLSYWEDADMFNSIILSELKYGLLKDSHYYYDRNNETSLSRKIWSSEKRYTYHIKESYFSLIKKSIAIHGRVIPYIQYLIALHYLDYLVEHNQKYINEMHTNIDRSFEFYSKKVFKYIDLKIIDNLSCLNVYKAYLYSLKGVKFPYFNHYKDIQLVINEYNWRTQRMVFSFSKNMCGLDYRSCVSVYFGKKKVTTATVKELRDVTLLGHPLEDICMAKYIAKVPLKCLLFGCRFKVEDIETNTIIWVKNDALVKRLYRRIMKKGAKK